ncbi:MAG: hypothetical protein CVU48_09570 [Candidatus Cloacimonetes bacterium HGW-Cloacimonetes-1]|nr:MAG: hypothetical protein CVU48_09570 [Candidatus Cloacimonetes bacterium HGW-Cloacimonetes-1]
MYSIRNIRIPLAKEYDLEFTISKKLNIPKSAFTLQRILRQAYDFRKKRSPLFVITALIDFVDEAPVHPDLEIYLPSEEPIIKKIALSNHQPMIIGMGPAGLFCALAMVEKGLKPQLFDQGDAIEQRSIAVDQFWAGSGLDCDSNVQFGEGGAGAFSDGKLTCRSKDVTIEAVFDLLIKFGAPQEIAYEALPHLGTDGIRKVIIKIREYLISCGCEFHYRHKLQDLQLQNGKIKKVVINNVTYQPEVLVLAIGNSARETFRMLHAQNVAIEAKDFAVGFRIEHQQDFIDERMYGHKRWRDIVGPATYRAVDKRSGSYTFCMCPGGFVVAASSEEKSIVTNGMSYANRANIFCNSALVTTVSKSDFGADVLGGMLFQEAIEKKAFQKGYHAPIQNALDYIRSRKSNFIESNSYRPQCYTRNIEDLFSDSINSRLKSALQNIDSSIHGFSGNGVLIAPETRTSSPIRILRSIDARSSVSSESLFAIGEGAGYAGGIISSAADGYRTGALFYV